MKLNYEEIIRASGNFEIISYLHACKLFEIEARITEEGMVYVDSFLDKKVSAKNYDANEVFEKISVGVADTGDYSVVLHPWETISGCEEILHLPEKYLEIVLRPLDMLEERERDEDHTAQSMGGLALTKPSYGSYKYPQKSLYSSEITTYT